MEPPISTASTQIDNEVVRYKIGAPGFLDVSAYDERRYTGPANEYKQAVMAAAYRRLLGDLTGKRVLDVGCGTGRGVADFARQAALAAGCDASLDMLSLARRKVAAERGNGCFAAAYAQDLPFRSASFDVVASLNFLHLFRVETQTAMVAEMKRVVRPGGILVLEFDNALHGLGIGLYKRWFSDERGSLPWEIRRLIGGGVRVAAVYGAVFPIVWRWTHRNPGRFMPLEKIAYYPPMNRFSHRVYYKLVRESGVSAK